MPYVVCECPSFGRNDTCLEFYSVEFCKNRENCVIKEIINKYRDKIPEILKDFDVIEVKDEVYS